MNDTNSLDQGNLGSRGNSLSNARQGNGDDDVCLDVNGG